MHYLVMCNHHTNLLFHMHRYRDEYPAQIRLDYQRKTAYLGKDVYTFFARTEDANQLLSMVFDGLIIPPGYNWWSNAEVMAMSRVRFQHVTTDGRKGSENP